MARPTKEYYAAVEKNEDMSCHGKMLQGEKKITEHDSAYRTLHFGVRKREENTDPMTLTSA